MRITERVHLDGRLDEAAWAAAPPIGPFLQRVPLEQVAPTEETEVKVLFDDDALYVGVLCRDREPRAVVASQLARDAELTVDDYVLIVLDPFADNRNGFFFQTNPVGARTDGQISNNDEDLDYDWDGIWSVAARRHEEGWTAEFAIPFKTLRFKPEKTTWGFNVERVIKRKREGVRWAAARQDAWISNLSEAGRLTGLQGLSQGRGWELRPYASGGEQMSSAEFKAGFDVTKNLAPNLTGVLTVNTDFAETEADDRQINLTRFPLFFPEKRQFFLEGAGVYDVAGLGSSNSDLIPFFSRRIGLLEGMEVPILAGLKVSGRVGAWNLGLLDVETRAIDETTVGGAPLQLDRQNLLAARVSRNLFTQSWVGVIATHGDPAGQADNTLVGADLRLATSTFQGGKNLSLDLWVQRTDDALRGDDWAFGGKLDYPNDLWDIALTYKRIGERFDPALGFLPRAGIQKLDFFATFRPRPGRWGIRQLFFEVAPLWIGDLAGQVQNARLYLAPLMVELESGDQVGSFVSPTHERLQEPFEIGEGVVIPMGSYDWTRYRLWVETADKRPWQVEGGVTWGSFYDGRLFQWEVGVGAQAKRASVPRLHRRPQRGAAAPGLVRHRDLLGDPRLELLSRPGLEEPPSIRQRVAPHGRAKPVSLYPPPGQRPLPGREPRVGEARGGRRPPARLRSRLGQAPVHVPLLSPGLVKELPDLVRRQLPRVTLTRELEQLGQRLGQRQVVEARSRIGARRQDLSAVRAEEGIEQHVSVTTKYRDALTILEPPHAGGTVLARGDDEPPVRTESGTADGMRVTVKLANQLPG